MSFENLGRATRAYVSGYARDRIHSTRLYARESRALIANFNGAVKPERVLGKAVWTIDANSCLGIAASEIQGKEAAIGITAVIPGDVLIRCEGTFDDGTVLSQLFLVTVLGDFMWPGDQLQQISSDTTITTVVPNDLVLSGTLPGGVVGTPYSAALVLSGTAYGPQWSITNGSLPPGLTIDPATGVISGTPSAPAIVTFTVNVVDTFGRSAQSVQNVNVSFSSGFVVNAGGTFRVHSGETQNYPLVTSFAIGADAVDIASSDGNEIVAMLHSVAPFIRLYVKNQFGGYDLVATPLSPALASYSENFVSMTADGQYMAITNGATQSLYKRDAGLNTYTRVANVTMADTAGMCRFSPDGTKLANRGATGQSLAVFNRVGDVLTAVPSAFAAQTNTRAMSWDITGTRIACVRNGGVYVVGVGANLVLAASLTTTETNGDIRWDIDARHFYTTSSVAPLLRAYDWPGAATIVPLANPTPQPPSAGTLEMSADGRVLIDASSANTTAPNEMTFWNVSAGQLTRFTPSSVTGTVVCHAKFAHSSDYWQP